MNKSTKTNFGLKAALSFSVGMTALMAGGITATAQEDGEETKRLNTVTITATKREQTLQDVPIAVSVVDDTVIRKAEIQDLGDLQSLVPSLSVGQLQSSANTNFRIRGFGNGANNAGIEPSVGVFIDGVYRSRSAAQISDLPNLQRVEVLRGPQSTLFGKNASAGVINIITRKPQFEFGGAIEGSYGNYNATRVKGDITGPLSETVAFSASGYFNKRDGYSDDLATGSDVNQRNRYGLRGQLLFAPNDDLEIRLIGDYDKIDEICCVVANIINGPTGGAVLAVGGNIDFENPFSYEVFNNFDSENDIENTGISAQVDYSMDFADLKSITAYRKSESATNADSDFTSADLIGQNTGFGDIKTFTQEIQLTSNNTEGMFDWMVGGFYFDESVETSGALTYGADFRGYADILSGGGLATVEGIIGGAPAIGNLFAQEGQGRFGEFGQDNTAWSLFGSVDAHLTDRITASVGLSYTVDEKDAFGRIVTTDVFSALDLVALGVAIGVPAALADNPAFNPLLPLQPLQFIPPFLDFPNVVENGSSNDDEVTYSLRLAYDVNDNINVYGSYATGFKATSWNLSSDSRPNVRDFIAGSPVTNPPASPIRDAGLAVSNLTSGTRLAGPETAKVWELGLKASFERVGFNIAIFDQTIEGFQSNTFTGAAFTLANAGEQSTLGVEWDITASLTDNLTVVFAGTAQDPVFDSFPNSAAGDISGQTPSGIPELATSTSVTYDFMVGSMEGYVRADWQHESETPYFDDPGNNALIGFEKSIDIVNGSIGMTTENGLRVSLWGRNLFETEFISTAFPSVAQAGSLSGYPNQPRTVGVTVRKEF